MRYEEFVYNIGIYKFSAELNTPILQEKQPIGHEGMLVE
jgi:hypothetical protein